MLDDAEAHGARWGATAATSSVETRPLDASRERLDRSRLCTVVLVVALDESRCDPDKFQRATSLLS